MRVLYFSILLIVFTSFTSCGDEERKIDDIPTKELTFEEKVRSHTQHYCNCAKPLNDFTNTIDVSTMDSAQYVKYEMMRAEFVKCFDPQGRYKLFRDTLSQEMKDKQMELFDKYRQEICPEIIPNR